MVCAHFGHVDTFIENGRRVSSDRNSTEATPKSMSRELRVAIRLWNKTSHQPIRGTAGRFEKVQTRN